LSHKEVALQKISHLFKDDDITMIEINYANDVWHVWVEKNETLTQTAITYFREEDVVALAQELAATVDKEVGTAHPLLEVPYIHGFRAFISLPPIAVTTTITFFKREE